MSSLPRVYNESSQTLTRLNRHTRIFVTVAVGVVIFVAGFASYAAIFSSSHGASDSLLLHGYVTIQAFHSDGVLYASWQGHNSISMAADNAMAQCLSGNSTTPNEWSGCSNFTTQVYAQAVSGSTGTPYFGTGTNTMLPTGCKVVGNPPTCNGWKVQGVVTFKGGSFPATVENAGAAGPSDADFDEVSVSPTFTVNQGDIIVVSVSFTFS